MDIPTNLKAAVMKRIDRGASGAVRTPADFLDLHGRDAVDNTLQRLVKAGTVRRIDCGHYDKRWFNHLTKQDNSPDPREVIEAIARRDQIRVLDGMTAANDLGLTKAVLAKIIVPTDARLKNIKIGNLSSIFKQAAASKLYWAGHPVSRHF